ncbi:MAG: tyrosine--tRNA ligase [Thermoproteota archaeon]
MDVEARIELVKRGVREIITLEELRRLFENGNNVTGYLGFEPSGLFHIGWLVWAYKMKDLIDAGVKFYLLAATWHAWINDKLGGSLELIKKAARHVTDVLEALGISKSSYELVDAEDIVGDRDYWRLVLVVAKSNSLARMRRALTIMGRRAEEGDMDFSKLIYPAMQVADIFYLDVDIALGGTDQRKAHMLARDTAEKIGRRKVVAIHTPLLTGLQGVGRMTPSQVDEDTHAVELKMSKSKPSTAIFVYESPDDIRRKIRQAYCPPRQPELNPVMEIAKYILLREPGSTLVIERSEKYGGTVEVASYEELEKLYASGQLHPLDLKNAVAEALIRVLEPVRKYFEHNREAREVLEELKRASITR